MKKLILFFFLFGCFSISCFSQFEGLYLHTKADTFFTLGKVKSAIIEYKKYFDENPDDDINTYNFAWALAIDNQMDSAFHYLKIAVEKDSTARALGDGDLFSLRGDERWTEIENGIIERIEARRGKKYENIELTKKLWYMKAKDQAFYRHTDLAEINEESSDALTAALWELKKKLNEENFVALEEIIAEHGWPKKSIVGGKASGTAFLIIQHSELERQKKYMPILKAAVDADEADKSDFAYLDDRINVREGRPQLYGSQLKRGEDGKPYFEEIFEPQFINKRRKEMGMRPIEDYASIFGLEWTIEQKE